MARTSRAELRLGTRGSELALWQAHAVGSRIAAAGGPPCRIVVVKTTGDRLQDAPLSEVGGKRLFVKEIEEALLSGDIDLAVHSSKDMPVVLPDGLALAAVLPREDPLDAIVLPESRPTHVESIEHLVGMLGNAPVFGTSSVRRSAQLSRLFSQARFVPIRGNLGTRLKKLESGECDALVLASAGLRRLGLAPRIALSLPASACVPAPGQGIIAVETRVDDETALGAARSIDDVSSHAALDIERSLVEALGGGCQTPIGALAIPIPSGDFELMAAVVAVDGTRAVRATGRGPAASGASLGARVAAQLIDEGAAEILEQARKATSSVGGLQP